MFWNDEMRAFDRQLWESAEANAEAEETDYQDVELARMLALVRDGFFQAARTVTEAQAAA